nr:unnamed protein product [Callosobruchus analis]
MPRNITKDPGPAELLKLILCACGTPCRAACGCRKAGLKCTVLCKHCAGETCENVQQSPTICENDDSDSDDDDFTSYESTKETNNKSEEPTPCP